MFNSWAPRRSISKTSGTPVNQGVGVEMPHENAKKIGPSHRFVRPAVLSVPPFSVGFGVVLSNRGRVRVRICMRQVGWVRPKC